MYHYPNTARWQWSRQDSIQYIGTKCAIGWCTIGPPGFAPEPIDQGEDDARRAIPGWHDAQFLAVNVETEAGSSLVPGPWATIYPLPLEEALYAFPTSPLWNEFQEVAIIVVEPMVNEETGGMDWVGPYDRKFNLDLGEYPIMTSTIRVRLLPGTETVVAQYRNNAETDAQAAQRAPVEVRRGLMKHGPARSARFRWQAFDDTIWIPCPDWGCCDVDPEAGG
jgi:hypothetical protein